MRISVNDVYQGRAYGVGDEWDSPTWSIKARARVRRLPPGGASFDDFIDFCLGTDVGGATSWALTQKGTKPISSSTSRRYLWWNERTRGVCLEPRQLSRDELEEEYEELFT